MAFVLFKGIEWRRRITVTDDDTGERTNLTGKTLLLEIRRRTSEAVLVSATNGDGITLLAQSGDTVGQADVVIPAEDSAGLDVAGHVLSVQLDAQVVLEPVKLPVRAL